MVASSGLNFFSSIAKTRRRKASASSIRLVSTSSPAKILRSRVTATGSEPELFSSMERACRIKGTASALRLVALSKNARDRNSTATVGCSEP